MVEIKRKFDKKHPLKIALEYYLDKEISYDNFTSIMPKVEHQMNFNGLLLVITLYMITYFFQTKV